MNSLKHLFLYILAFAPVAIVAQTERPAVEAQTERQPDVAAQQTSSEQLSVQQPQAQQSAVGRNTPDLRQSAAVQSACPLKFGYFSYDAALKSMPEYDVAMRNMAELKSKYDSEAKRVEKEFNEKYELFLEGQRDFPATILKKRQSELQELLDKNIAFKEESRRLLEAAEKDVFAPLHDRIAATLKAIGERKGYAFIINTDNRACPFASRTQGEDINQIVKDSLR